MMGYKLSGSLWDDMVLLCDGFAKKFFYGHKSGWHRLTKLQKIDWCKEFAQKNAHVVDMAEEQFNLWVTDNVKKMEDSKMDVREKRRKIENKLIYAEGIYETAKRISDAVSKYEEEGGKISLCIYPKNDNSCITELDAQTGKECVGVVLNKFNELIISARKEINEMMDSMMTGNGGL